MFVTLHTDMHSWVSMLHGQVHTLTVFRWDRLSFVPCPASGFSSPHLQLHCKPQCSTKAAPVQIPSLAPYYLLSKGSMLAAGLQSAELLQASLVLLSQESLLDGWPLAISERPGEYNGKTPGLGCREWHRQSRGEGESWGGQSLLT